MRALVLGFVWALLAALPLCAQDSLPPWEGGLTASLGQPRRWGLNGLLTLGADARGGKAAPSLEAGASLAHPIGSPVVGLLEARVEALFGLQGARATAASRLLVGMPVLGLDGGLELATDADGVSGVIGLTVPGRRGGILGGGSMLRGEWVFGQGGAGRVGVVVPVGRPLAGRTRRNGA